MRRVSPGLTLRGPCGSLNLAPENARNEIIRGRPLGWTILSLSNRTHGHGALSPGKVGAIPGGQNGLKYNKNKNLVIGGGRSLGRTRLRKIPC